MRNYKDLAKFAAHNNFVVTSTNGGNHNVNSKHYLGLAIDVRTRDKENAEIETFIKKCEVLGVKVRDERQKPKGQKVWSGAHLHLEICADTLNAVRRFQKVNALKVDGIAGRETFDALDKWIS